MILCDEIYQGPVLGFGMSGQAGSSFLVLGVLARLIEQSARAGKELSAVYAMDRNSCPPIGDLLQRTADHLGIQTVPTREVSLSEHRRAIDSSSFCWYGAVPDIEPYIQDELALFNELRPSMLIGFLRPTLGYSRTVYEQHIGRRLPYMGMGCSLIAGPGSYGVPADFFPPLLAPVADYLGGESRLRDFIIRQVYGAKITRATNYLYEGFQKCEHSGTVPRLPFMDALFGDLPLILSSPLLSRYRPPDSRLVGLMDVSLSLTEEQERRQVAIVEKLREWRSQGMRIIFISMGSTGHSFPKVLAALAPMAQDERRRVRLLISTTVVGDEARGVMEELERGSILVQSDWMQMSDILPLTDVLVTHGGLNSIESAIRRDVPIVVAASQQMEQGFNGLAIRSRGLGEVVWNYRIDSICDVVGRVLDEHDSYSERIRQYKKSCPELYAAEEQGQALVSACNEVMGK